MYEFNPFIEPEYPDWSSEQDIIPNCVYEKDNQKVIVVYTKGYYFSSYQSWRNTVHGKQIMNFLDKPCWKDNLKAVFFDSQISPDEHILNEYIEDKLEDIWEDILDMDQKENIVCIASCMCCSYNGSLSFYHPDVKLIDVHFKMCNACILHNDPN